MRRASHDVVCEPMEGRPIVVPNRRFRRSGLRLSLRARTVQCHRNSGGECNRCNGQLGTDHWTLPVKSAVVLGPLHDVGGDRRQPDHKPGAPAYATIQAPGVTTTTKTASSQPRVWISRDPVANELESAHELGTRGVKFSLVQHYSDDPTAALTAMRLIGRRKRLPPTARSIHRKPTGAGGIGAPSRFAFGMCRVLPTRKSMAGFSFASFFASTSFLPSSLTGTPFFVGSDFSATGWGETSGVALASLPERGHEKSSARPAGATKAAPRLKTFAAIGSDVVCAGWLSAPRRSPRSLPPIDSGSTGPTLAWGRPFPILGSFPHWAAPLALPGSITLGGGHGRHNLRVSPHRPW
jgi:hypothetical protein